MEDDMVPAYSTRCDSDKPKEVAVCSKNQSGLQKFGPLPWRRRRQLLLDSGVRRIDSSETKECRDIRASRERCGCECPGQCLREACSCSLNGIPCQVEKVPFPCACCEEACENPCGRRQYSPDIAHEHYRRTIARLEAEQAAAELPVSDPRLGEGKQDTKDECLSVLDGLSEDFKRACSLTESLPCGSH
ncbi:cysteine/serine-rich nuclear protein 1 [Rhipicephalus sanguineus]|uniref:cysteine/serine-rich nuclear protein 1 n=1 Tax=Rhipicephalus sanguineus TaxID=34632 RepID=UPI0020C4B286|nr:cysteine/serine-rich nuclear protein 1 [Rhipicephalus sanguineus]